MPDPEFVSISRASQLLEAPERTVRRMAAKLADTDRQLADRGTRLVRLSALASLMGRRYEPSGKPLPVAPVADRPSEVADTEEASSGHMADTSDGLADSGGHSESLLIEQLRAELESVKLDREHWRGQAEKSLQLVDQAQRLQLAAQHRVAELEGKLLPAEGSNLRSADEAQASQVALSDTPGGSFVESSIDRIFWWRRNKNKNNLFNK